MRIIIVGPGRAGGALAVAFHNAGHEIAAIYARRSDDQAVARRLATIALPLAEPMPEADLVMLAVRDDAIADVAEQVAPLASRVGAAVHISGLTPVDALGPLVDAGLTTGSFHPLQSLPSWHRGAEALAGAHIAITAPAQLSERLHDLAASIGASGFHLPDERKALYHAAAAASANYVTTALSIGEQLFAAAGVDADVAQPLVRSAVSNAFDLGALAALTGPIARGDVRTVAAQIEAIRDAAPDVLDAFIAFGRVTADLAGTSDDMAGVLS